MRKEPRRRGSERQPGRCFRLGSFPEFLSSRFSPIGGVCLQGSVYCAHYEPGSKCRLMSTTVSKTEQACRSARSVRVLIVDDAPAMREALSSFVQASAELALAGCAHHGQEGVELAVRLQSDLVLMDMHMPVMNGLDATRLIKQQPDAPLVAMMSTDARAANRAAAQTAGADTFLDKAELFVELRPLLRRLCERIQQEGLANHQSDGEPAPPGTPPRKGLVA